MLCLGFLIASLLHVSPPSLSLPLPPSLSTSPSCSYIWYISSTSYCEGLRGTCSAVHCSQRSCFPLGISFSFPKTPLTTFAGFNWQLMWCNKWTQLRGPWGLYFLRVSADSYSLGASFSCWFSWPWRPLLWDPVLPHGAVDWWGDPLHCAILFPTFSTFCLPLRKKVGGRGWRRGPFPVELSRAGRPVGPTSCREVVMKEEHLSPWWERSSAGAPFSSSPFFSPFPLTGGGWEPLFPGLLGQASAASSESRWLGKGRMVPGCRGLQGLPGTPRGPQSQGTEIQRVSWDGLTSGSAFLIHFR